MTPEEDEKLHELLQFPIDIDQSFLGAIEKAAERDKTGLIKKWLKEEVYTNRDLMKDLDPLSVTLSQGYDKPATSEMPNHHVGALSHGCNKARPEELPNQNVVLTVRRVDYVEQVGLLSRLCRGRKTSRAKLTFNGTELVIETPAAQIKIPATGTWQGIASVPLRVLCSMADSPVSSETITLAVAPCRFMIGTMSSTCVWKKKATI